MKFGDKIRAHKLAIGEIFYYADRRYPFVKVSERTSFCIHLRADYNLHPMEEVRYTGQMHFETIVRKNARIHGAGEICSDGA
jgi:hypothetical protein